MSNGLYSRRTLRAVLVCAILASVACAFQQDLPPTISPDCESDVNPTEADLDYILSFPGNTFVSSDWDRSFTVNPSRATVTWLSDKYSGVAYIDYLIYSCGHTSRELSEYYNEENFRSVLFAAYSAFEQLATCQSPDGSLTLHRFTGHISDTDYSINFWTLLRGETRVVDFTLALPTASESQLHAFAESLFPQLPSCPNS